MAIENGDGGQELNPVDGADSIPLWTKLLITFLAILVAALPAYVFVDYVIHPSKNYLPKEIGASSILIFSFSLIALVWVPWRKMGISKVGGVEFRDMIQGQASEHAEEIAEIQQRLEILESQTKNIDSNSIVNIESAEIDSLKNLLLKFLTQYDKWAFSPARIASWGSKQPGFSELGGYDKYDIRSMLQKMVSENKLETRVSKKGNTLYRIS